MDEINGGADFRPFFDPALGLPVGFGMAAPLNVEALDGFGALTEAEKEQTLLKAKGAKTKKERDVLLNSLGDAAGEEVQKMMEKDKAEG